MHWHELRSRSIGKCCVRTFIFVFMSTMQDKIVGKMFGNVLYHSGIVILTVFSPIRANSCWFWLFLLFFFYSFVVKATPRLFDIFSSKNTAAFTPANTVCVNTSYKPYLWLHTVNQTRMHSPIPTVACLHSTSAWERSLLSSRYAPIYLPMWSLVTFGGTKSSYGSGFKL